MRGAFEPKDLLKAFPVVGKPGISIRTTGDLAMLEPPMPFVPRLRVFPPTTIRDAILKQISTILVQGGLVVLGHQEIVSRQPVDLCAEGTLRMHRIQRKNAPFDRWIMLSSPCRVLLVGVCFISSTRKTLLFHLLSRIGKPWASLRGSLRGSLRPLRMVFAGRFEHTCSRCSDYQDASIFKKFSSPIQAVESNEMMMNNE
jgi:hypothetical protein